MAMTFMRTFAGSGRFWDSKVVQLPHFADLFKRNYFTCAADTLDEAKADDVETTQQ